MENQQSQQQQTQKRKVGRPKIHFERRWVKQNEYNYREIIREAQLKYGLTNVEIERYSKRISDINLEIARKVREEDFVFKLPYNLGSIYIGAEMMDVNKPRVDIRRSILCKRKVYYLNEHTDGWGYSTEWRKGKFTNRTLYVLYFTRQFKRAIYLETKKGMRYQQKTNHICPS